MSRYGSGGWAPYVPVAERRRKAMREVEKMRKKGQSVAPVVIEGWLIATTFWGKAWCANLESYQDYENRLPRGRTYVRNGSVIDLQIASKEVRAVVSGSSIYQVKVSVAALPQAVWRAICMDCSAGIDSLVELLQGRFNKGVMDRLCRQDNGLFPKPSEIKFSCSCPDYASMCKHIAAVLYGIGSRLDENPELLFLLRDVNHADLLAHIDTAVPLAKQTPASARLLETDDISNLFGLDMAEWSVELELPQPLAKIVKPIPSKTAAKRSTKAPAKTPAMTSTETVAKTPAKTSAKVPAKTLAQVPERKPAVEKPKTGTAPKRNSAMANATPTKEPEHTPVIEAERKKSVRKVVETRISVRNAAQESTNSQKPLRVQSAGIESVETLAPDRKAERSRSNQSDGVPFKYQDPLFPEQTWSGKGRRPKWVLDHLKAGGEMEELEVG
ncbi:MAG: H-NS histone family protein [Magnetococcales bacterium]|nr:H-NS histone family protein [Magnetococcales bacterium]